VKYDVIVIGVGAMGSATCYALAKRGANVLGLEQFSLGHSLGSSHGDSRLIRKAYFEHADYVPLCARSYELWDRICEESGKSLFHRTGVLIFGPGKDSAILEGVLQSAGRYGIPVDQMSPAEAQRRFPQFTAPAGYHAVLEADAGFLEVEACVTTLAQLAEARGARMQANEVVTAWRASGDGVEVSTRNGVYTARRLVVTAGPWASRLLADLQLPLTVRRVMQLWFNAPHSLRVESGLPCFAFDFPEGFVYGMPAHGARGLKIASHAPGEVVRDPLALRRELLPGDLLQVERVRSECFTGLDETPEHFAACMYTLTPDEHFIVDRHPDHQRVAFAAGFSGHGFKFAPVMGEVLADLALEGSTSEPVAFLRMR
jgi:sarcosine oxidase